MSTINTNSIDVNYPVPGTNNSSQGFRNNFQSIKTNLDAAGNEITDLQNKVVLKAALDNTTLNNDMANALISNAAILGFRSTTYNLGAALAGTVTVDVTLGDVHYGTVANDVVFQFTKWAPAQTQQSIDLLLTISNAQATISWPSTVVSNNLNYGTVILENYANVANVATVTAPSNVTQLNYRLTTNDCGNTIYIQQTNRPFQSTQIQNRTPAPTGSQGDTAGAVAVDTNYLYVCTADYNSTVIDKSASATYASNNEIVLNNLSSVAVNSPVVFSGTTFGNVSAGTIYYVKSVVGGNSSITLSNTRTGGVAGSTFVLTNGTGNMVASFTNGSNIWTRISLTAW